MKEIRTVKMIESVDVKFVADDGKIILHYPCDDEYCYYLITDTEDYEPEEK